MLEENEKQLANVRSGCLLYTSAQTLYEGVDIAGHGTMGLITYMRTDSLRISDEAVAAAKEYIAGAYGEAYICPYKRTWKTKSATAAQDAHEAIRPSVPSLTPDEVDKSISGDTAKPVSYTHLMCIRDSLPTGHTARKGRRSFLCRPFIKSV